MVEAGNSTADNKGLYYKTFYGRNLRIFIISYIVFVLGKPFQPSLMFSGKAGAYPSEKSFIVQDPRREINVKNLKKIP